MSTAGDDQATALHRASLNDHVEVVKLLLAHPDIDVNVMNKHGYTPFSYSCAHGTMSVFCALLKDPRVGVTLEDYYGCTPLWWASQYTV